MMAVATKKAIAKKAAAPKTPAAVSLLAIESWPIDRPVPFVGNARKVSPRAVETLAASIKEFGFRQPIVVDKNDTIIAGHTRLLAAQWLGLESVPVHVAQNLTKAQVRAYRLMDNRVHDETSWIEELVGPQLKQLEKESYDLALTGFSIAENAAFLRVSGTPPPEDKTLPRLPNGRFRGAGDVWLLGKHYLMVGAGDDKDVDAVVLAWQKFTKQDAVLSGDGRTFTQVNAARHEA